MRKSITILTLILLCAVLAIPALAQVRPPDPTPPNPAPNIPAPSVPKVTQPPQPVAPTQAEPISPTASALPETDKQPAKSPSNKAVADQDPVEYVFMALIALIILGFGILIGRMSVKTK